MSTELRAAVLEDCLAVSRYAMVIFDAVEARHIDMDTATTLLAMGAAVDGIRVGMSTLLLTGAL